MHPVALASSPSVYGLRDHVYHFDFGREGFLASTIRHAGLIIVIAAWAFARVFGVELAGLLYHPTVTVGVVGRLFGRAMDLAGPVQNCV